uniref:Putative ubiquinol-cytochrome c reductase complex n=1 Tax=Rhodnius prolixus TaxID=13249 RepID=A0A4P6DAI2_RHOPR
MSLNFFLDIVKDTFLPKKPLGQKHAHLVLKWLPSAGLYGLAGAFLVIYVSEWKVITKYLPFYGSRDPPSNKSETK